MDYVLSRSAGSVGQVSHTGGGIPAYFRAVQNVLTSEECSNIIALAESTGFEQAAFYTDYKGTNHYNLDIRRSQRLLVDSFAFAATLWERIRDQVPHVWPEDGSTAVGLNERLRILKYLPGDEFKSHRDGTYVGPAGDSSKITVIIYLNEGYEGAFTHYETNEGVFAPITPHTGSVVLQDQRLLHMVPPLVSGVKYAIRTEVMFRRLPRTGEGEFRVFRVRDE
jgi:hypothetical protein